MDEQRASVYRGAFGPQGDGVEEVVALSPVESVLLEHAQSLIEDTLQDAPDARLRAADAIIEGVLADTEGDG